MKSQYRRTYFGPWWITLQQVIFIAGLSLLFGVLLGQDLQTFVPYVTTGFIGFSWITGLIQSGSTCIVDNASSITTSPGPLSIYPLRAFANNTLQFAHDAVAIVLVIAVFQVHLSASMVLLPGALLLIAIKGRAIGLWLGPLVARYRDVGQIVTSVIRVLFFFTPIFWVTTDLSNAQLAILAGWNPVAYLLEFFRAPLLGQWPSTTAIVGSIIITFLSALLGLWKFSRNRNRLAYWL